MNICNRKTAAEDPNSPAAVLRFADYGRMAIDAEFLLGHNPIRFLRQGKFQNAVRMICKGIKVLKENNSI